MSRPNFDTTGPSGQDQTNWHLKETGLHGSFSLVEVGAKLARERKPFVNGLAAKHLLHAATAHTSLLWQRLQATPEMLWSKALQEFSHVIRKNLDPSTNLQSGV